MVVLRSNLPWQVRCFKEAKSWKSSLSFFFFETEVGQMEPAHEELFSGFWE
jgi:hypothetical protein